MQRILNLSVGLAVLVAIASGFIARDTRAQPLAVQGDQF